MFKMKNSNKNIKKSKPIKFIITEAQLKRLVDKLILAN
jgi:hypothetical protein